MANREEDIEDGEIFDSGDEMVMEPVKSNHAVDIATSMKPALSLQMPHYPQKAAHMQHRIGKPQLSSDEDDSDSEMENFNSPCKKKPQLYWPKPSSEVEFQNPLLLNKGVKGFKKQNNVWGSVLTEQSLTTVVSGVSTEQAVESFRDVETYDYTRALLDKRLEQDSDKEAHMGDTSEGEDPEDGRDLVDIETFGTDIAPKKPNIKKRLGKRSNSRTSRDFSESGEDSSSESDHKDDSDSRPSIRDRLGCKPKETSSGQNSVTGNSVKDRLGGRKDRKKDIRMNRKRSFNYQKQQESQSREIKERLGRRWYDPTVDRSHIHADIMDPVEVVVEEIIRVLNEPEHQVPLFTELIELMGTQKALELLYMTEDLEASGGLMILNGGRRRTPGGVFLTLVKEDEALDKSKVNEIFKVSSQRQWKSVKERKKQQQLQRRLEREAEEKDKSKEVEMKEEDQVLPVKKEVLCPVVEDDDPFADAPDVEIF